jgi:hypothetical protein
MLIPFATPAILRTMDIAGVYDVPLSGMFRENPKGG